MPLFRGSRPLKRWRYVAVFCEELMACAALVQIGPARQSFWALYMREEKLMRERTRLLPRRGEVELEHGRAGTGTLPAAPGRMRVHGRGVLLDLQLEEQAGIEALCPSGLAQVWTRTARCALTAARREELTRSPSSMTRSGITLATPSGTGAPASVRVQTASRLPGTL
jgi:hypothetical protein